MSPKQYDECILFVEDNPLLLKSIQPFLRKLGYKVLPALDSTEALRLWDENTSSIDILLTDITMPHGLSGVELAKELRSKRPELAVIISSGYVEEAAQLEAIIGGHATSFLQKPYNPSKLQEIIRETLDNARALKLIE